MNNTVTLSQLITRLAKVADTDTNTTRRFLRSFFAAIEESLAAGEEVSVKGIGTFRRIDSAFDAEGKRVAFAPDRALAEAINAPFAMFEPVELAEGVDLSAADEDAAAPEPEEVSVPEEKITAEEETSASIEPEPVSAASEPMRYRWPEEEEEEAVAQKNSEEKTVDTAQEEDVLPETPAESTPAGIIDREKNEEVLETLENEISESSEAAEEYEEELEAEEEEEHRSSLWLWIGAAAFVIAAGLIGYWLAVRGFDNSAAVSEESVEALADDTTAVIEETVDVPAPVGDTIAAATQAEESVKTEPEPVPAAKPAAPEPRYDTVTGKRFLASMAREYYGRGVYWVYIYEANPGLGNPNHISQGTRVLIPEKSSFAAATEEETQAIAERKQAEIFKRYK